MSYKTLEVELENGRVHPSGSETLPARAHALLTILAPDTLAANETSKDGESLADRVAHLCGIGNGTHTDLSTNKRHMDDFGESSHPQ